MNTPDRTFWFVTSTEDGTSILCTSEQDAYETWLEVQNYEVIEANPYEGTSYPLRDDFLERLEGEEIAARSMRAHERSFVAGRM